MNRQIIGFIVFILIGSGCFFADIARTQGAEPKAKAARPAPMPGNLPALDHANLLNQLLFSVSSRSEAQDVLDAMALSGDTGFVAGLYEKIDPNFKRCIDNRRLQPYIPALPTSCHLRCGR